MILLYLEPGCQKRSQYVMWYWAASTLYDNSVMLSHFKMHFDILYTSANAHMYLCTASFGMKRTRSSVGKKTAKRVCVGVGGVDLYNSHSSIEHTVRLTHRPVPLRTQSLADRIRF